MNNKLNKILAIAFLFTFCSLITVGGGRAMSNGVLYRVTLESNKNQAIVIKQNGKEITLVMEGFGESIALKADGGGTSTCRTIIEHNSDQAKVTLSLPVPDPHAPCRMLPGFVTAESNAHKISLSNETVKKVSGTNARLRTAVQKTFGAIEEN